MADEVITDVIPVKTGTEETVTQEQPAAEDDVKGIVEKYGNDPVKLAQAFKELQKHATEQGQLASTLKDVIDGLSKQDKQPVIQSQQPTQNVAEARRAWAEKLNMTEEQVDGIYALASSIAGSHVQAATSYQMAMQSLTPDEKKIMEDAAKRGERILPETAKAIAKGMNTDEEIKKAREDALRGIEEFTGQVETGSHAIPMKGKTPVMDPVNKKAYQLCLDKRLVKNEQEYWKIKGNRSFDGGTEKKQKLQWSQGGGM